MPPLSYASLERDREPARLGEILGQCFNISSPEYWDYYANNIGLENFRIVRQGETLQGGLALIKMGQWFGGQRVPMTGIAAVGIAPEYRGTGAAKTLMSEALRELQTQNIPLSVLYAATQRPYRNAGYEQAGTYCLREIATDTIILRQSDRTLPVERLPLEIESFSALYTQWAKQNPGNLARPPLLWKLLLEPPGEKVFAYRLGNEGYVIFRQVPEPKAQLILLDWVALTPQAVSRLWTFLADHRSQILSVQWCGSLVDPLLLALPEQTETLKKQERWMLRIIDVAQALSQRGYPATVTGELHLDINDPLLAENCDRFILHLNSGQPTVTRGGKGSLKLSIRALAPLYTGLFTPHQLQRIGYLEADEHSLTLATQCFSGSEPWMADKF
ncbi:MAG: GNAT family N-acetyltransferase [Desertifilum sp.]|nr:GNAT family N-acetyltransferase [Desertifilum sp.]